MFGTLPDRDLSAMLERLAEAGRRFAADYPGDGGDRQPIHTVYGGAHLFRSDSARRLGAIALQTVREYGSDFVAFARAIGMPGTGRLPRSPQEIHALAQQPHEHRADPNTPAILRLANSTYARMLEKLEREPVEDYRIDFEDGYGHRPDEEEDQEAARVGAELAKGIADRTLPPFSGIRIKPLTTELAPRSLRTLDRVVSGVLEASGGALPPGFVVTLPKVSSTAQVEVLADALERIEGEGRLAPGSLRLELMVELPQSLIGPHGEPMLPALVSAARGRCRGAHFGTYDYTAALGITAPHQTLHHPACEFARRMMQASLAGTPVMLSDGATTLLPVPPHRSPAGGPPLAVGQRIENRTAVYRAWRTHYEDVRRSLAGGFYQGWDLHPAQLPTRYAAVYAFFLESLPEVTARLRHFTQRQAQATRLGNVADDAATGQGLLNFFLRGLSCGAIAPDEVLATGLTLEELRLRSFAKIQERRRAGAT